MARRHVLRLSRWEVGSLRVRDVDVLDVRHLSFSVVLAAAAAGCSVQVPSPDMLWDPLDGPVADASSPTGPSFPLPASCHVEPSSVASSNMVDVPAGQFAMGCDPKADTECKPDENPEHMVALSDFAIDATEVTQAQYALCVEAARCTAPYCAWDPCALPNRPMACVDRAQAIAYCAFAGKVLPTEAEWEKAARGTDGRKFPWGDAPASCSLAQMSGCGASALDVGSLPAGASPYGALDMAGNVVEWTFDFYSADYYASSPAANPTGPAAGSSYVGRGGGWQSEEVWQRTGARDDYEPTYVKETMGLRCVRAGGLAAPIGDAGN